MKHAALYVRVSTEDQKENGLSVENQTDALIKYCKENGYTYEIYNDAGISGNITYKKRPAMMRLIDDCRANTVDIILFTRIDRFFRSMRDYYLVMDLVNNKEWNAIWQKYSVDSAQGRFNVNIALSVAQMESDIDSERIKSVLDYKRSKGEYIGRVPLGYKRIDGHLYKDENTEAYVERIFTKYLQTHCVRDAIEQFDGEVFAVTAKTVRTMMANKVYCGIAQEGTCEPYITVEQFEELQRIRKLRTREPKNGRSYIFSGLLRCKICGRSMTAKYTRNNAGVQYNGYMCRELNSKIKHPYNVAVQEKKLEKTLLNSLDEMVRDYNFEVEMRVKNDDHVNYEKKRKKLEGKLERIKLLFEEGDITMEEYREKRNGLRDELSHLRKPQEISPVDLPSDWKEIYNELTPEGKRVFWHRLIDTIIIDKHDIVNVIFL